MLALQPDVANIDNPVMPYIYLNNTMVLAKYFDKYSNIKKQPGAYFHMRIPPMYFFYNMLELAFPEVYRILYGAWSVTAVKKHLSETMGHGTGTA